MANAVAHGMSTLLVEILKHVPKTLYEPQKIHKTAPGLHHTNHLTILADLRRNNLVGLSSTPFLATAGRNRVLKLPRPALIFGSKTSPSHTMHIATSGAAGGSLMGTSAPHRQARHEPSLSRLVSVTFPAIPVSQTLL